MPQCKIDSFGPFGAGTLYSGDGVVIQQSSACPATGCTGCTTILRYPRSTFGSGNITFIWARQQSTSTGGGSASSIYPQESNLFQIDARHRLDANTAVEHGRIFISVSSNGLSNHIYDAQRVEVSDSDVVLRVKFMSSSPMTFYAVRQIKIASQATSLKFPLILMQPYAAPNSPLFSGDSRGVSSSSAGIADFSCTEVDTSSSDGGRAILLAMSSSGVNTAAFMHSFYQTRDDMSKPAPSSPIDCGTNSSQACSNYYTHGLRRQYTTPADFVDFAALRGGSFLAQTPGYHLVCVSARGANADGKVMLQYKKKGSPDKRSCTPPLEKQVYGVTWKMSHRIPNQAAVASAAVVTVGFTLSTSYTKLQPTLSPSTGLLGFLMEVPSPLSVALVEPCIPSPQLQSTTCKELSF